MPNETKPSEEPKDEFAKVLYDTAVVVEDSARELMSLASAFLMTGNFGMHSTLHDIATDLNEAKVKMIQAHSRKVHGDVQASQDAAHSLFASLATLKTTPKPGG